MPKVDVKDFKVGNNVQVPGAASRSRMSELVKGKGAFNVRDYYPHFEAKFESSDKAWAAFEEWVCNMKDGLIQMSEIELRPYQKEFSDAITKSVLRNDGEMMLGEWARQSGKTETLASTGYALAVLLAPINIGIFGPKQRQAQIMWNRVKERYNPDVVDNLGLEIEQYGGNTFKLSSGSSVQAITCGSGNIEGETFDVIFIDETQKIGRRMILSQIWPMGAETNATKVVIGSPTFEDCWFREQVAKLEGTDSCFKYDWRVPAKYSKTYRRSVKKMLKSMSKDSDEFRTQFELEWILDEGMFMELDDWKRMSTPPTMAPSVTPGALRDPEIDSKWQIRGGLDLAKRQDSTVLTITGKYYDSWNPYHDDLTMETIVLLDVMELQGVEYPDQVDMVERQLERWNADMVGVDSNGAGDPTTDMLKRQLDQHVEGITFSRGSKHDLYKHAERKIHVKDDRAYADLILPHEFRNSEENKRNIRRMKNQYLSLTKDYNGSRMQVEAQEGEKDDYPDSAALAMWVQDANYSEDERTMSSSAPVLGTVNRS